MFLLFSPLILPVHSISENKTCCANKCVLQILRSVISLLLVWVFYKIVNFLWPLNLYNSILFDILKVHGFIFNKERGEGYRITVRASLSCCVRILCLQSMSSSKSLEYFVLSNYSLFLLAGVFYLCLSIPSNPQSSSPPLLRSIQRAYSLCASSACSL